jgi:hypothetical protein
MFRAFFNRPAPALVQVARYRGTAAGWQLIGAPRTAADAARFLAMWERIDPAATLRVRPV